ncbi:MAG TPA: serine/threonine protein kinase, partial [Polyangiaceae bacterium]|nr:serine/threonine protein kinase [Polyangiaceae bacterium]
MGTTIGSPYYMAPEQAQGLASLDHRADVWSAAAIAYECLTGKVPFPGSTGPAILLAILTHDPAPISESGKEQSVPATLDIVMERALAKDPGLRQKTIGELADEVGHAYGLEGDHRVWATVSEQKLGELIAAGLPNKLAEHAAHVGAPMNLSN